MRRAAFTLVELLMVIAIIALLAALLLPALREAREKGRRVVCLSNQHELFIAINLYADDNSQWIPVPDRPATSGINFENVGYYGAGTYWWGTWPVTAFPAGNLYPYLGNNRTWLCPSFRGKDIDAANWGWYSWTQSHTAPSATGLLSTYYYPPPFTIGSYLGTANVPTLRLGESFYFSSVYPNITYNRAALLCDVMAGDDGITPAGYWGFPGSGFAMFLTAHYDRGRNLGGNVVHGDGSGEWLPFAGWGNGNWFTFAGGGNDHWFVSVDRQL